jgi:hypothetical protein
MSTAPIPPGVETYLTSEPRGWRGELRDGTLAVEARGDTAEAVVAELLRLYRAGGKDPVLVQGKRPSETIAELRHRLAEAEGETRRLRALLRSYAGLIAGQVETLARFAENPD